MDSAPQHRYYTITLLRHNTDTLPLSLCATTPILYHYASAPQHRYSTNTPLCHNTDTLPLSLCATTPILYHYASAPQHRYSTITPLPSSSGLYHRKYSVIESSLHAIIGSQNFALNNLSRNFTEVIMCASKTCLVIWHTGHMARMLTHWSYGTHADTLIIWHAC